MKMDAPQQSVVTSKPVISPKAPTVRELKKMGFGVKGK